MSTHCFLTEIYRHHKAPVDIQASPWHVATDWIWLADNSQSCGKQGGTRLGLARMPQEWYCTSGGTPGYSGGSWMSKKNSWSWYGVPSAPATAARSRSILWEVGCGQGCLGLLRVLAAGPSCGR